MHFIKIIVIFTPEFFYIIILMIIKKNITPNNYQVSFEKANKIAFLMLALLTYFTLTENKCHICHTNDCSDRSSHNLQLLDQYIIKSCC